MLDSAFRYGGGRIAEPRNGTTLVEVLGTLSVLLVLGVSAASILGSITQIGVRSNRAMLSRASVERLAKVFRDDIHQAGEISVSDAPVAFALSSGPLTVRYQWNEKRFWFRRSVSEGEKQLSIETFDFSDDVRPGISVTDDLVTLRLNDEDLDRKMGRRWVIEARRG